MNIYLHFIYIIYSQPITTRYMQIGTTEAKFKGKVSFKKKVGVMVNNLVFWLTVCLILKMCY